MHVLGEGVMLWELFIIFWTKQMCNLLLPRLQVMDLASGKSAATTYLGKAGVLHGSKTILMQTTDGQVVEPHSISAGLDYPGIGPVHAHLL